MDSTQLSHTQAVGGLSDITFDIAEGFISIRGDSLDVTVEV